MDDVHFHRLLLQLDQSTNLALTINTCSQNFFDDMCLAPARLVHPKKTQNSRSELEITKITLQLAGDLRSICAAEMGVWCMVV
jgi:hypothetical protein